MFNAKSLLRGATLAATSVMVANTAYAGLFDSVRMALSGKSVAFIDPPAVQEMVNYRYIGLVSAPGKSTDPMIPVLEARMTELAVNQNPYFRQVRVGAPSAAETKDQKWAVIEVSTGVWASNETSGNETRTQCPKGKFFCKDNEAAHTNVSCRTRTANVGVKITIRDAITQNILVSDSASNTAESKVCQDVGGTLDTPETLLGKAAGAVASQLMVKYTPAVKKQPMELIEEDSSLPEASEQMKQAYRLASNGNLQTALKVYNKLIADGKSNGAVLFNAAFCEHAQGHYKTAVELYKKAKGSPKAPTDLIEKFMAPASDYVATGIDSATD